MEKPMRRKERAMPLGDAIELVSRGEYGVLCTVDAEGIPHGVPMNHVWDGGLLYFHCANEGLKAENIAARPGVCYTVVGEVAADPEMPSVRHGASAVVYGEAALIEAEEEKRRILTLICEKYHIDPKGKMEKSGPAIPKTAVYKITPRLITGKKI